MPAPTLTKIETGRLRASPERQAAIAAALELDVDDLFVPLEAGPNAERNRSIADEYVAGAEVRELVGRYNLDRSVIKRILWAEGIKLRPKGADAEVIEKAVALYTTDGKPSGKTIATLLEVPRSNVFYWLRRRGVARRLSTWFHAVPERHWRCVLSVHEGREQRSCTISPKSKRRAKYALAGVLASPPGTRHGGKKKGYTDKHVTAARKLKKLEPNLGRERLARQLTRLGLPTTEKQARAILAELTG